MSEARQVVVFSIGRSETIVWHETVRLVRVRDEPTHREFEHRTACGKLLSRWSFDPSPARSQDVVRVEAPVTWLRLDQARKLGRCCARCEAKS